MSIHIYTGVPGSGKSLHAARDIRDALRRRYPRPVIANFDLAESADVSRETFTYVPNEAMCADVITKIAVDFWDTTDRTFAEDYILLVLDEAQLLFNSRLWSARDRMAYLEFLSQSRKYGIKVILIAQSAKMVDNQFRMLVEVEHNHRRIQSMGPVGSLLALPFAGRLFLVVRYLYQCSERLGMDLLLASPGDMRMYDSYARFERSAD